MERSRDGGETWARVGKVPGEPYKFNARGAEALDLALSDGTIVATEDGGKTWKTAFQPLTRPPSDANLYLCTYSSARSVATFPRSASGPPPAHPGARLASHP